MDKLEDEHSLSPQKSAEMLDVLINLLWKDQQGNNNNTDYTQAVKLDPIGSNAYFWRGLAYYQKNDYDRAIADCTQAIILDLNDWNSYLLRGWAYKKRQLRPDTQRF